MKYRSVPALACYVKIYNDSFPKRFEEHREDYIYMAHNKPIEQPPCGSLPFSELPEQVQHEVNWFFESVFLLPAEKRQKYIEELPLMEVTV